MTMRLHSKQISNGRWGIYENRTLLATIGCSQSCRAILKKLKQRRLRKIQQEGCSDDREELTNEDGLTAASIGLIKDSQTTNGASDPHDEN